jgi:hypothetical protein
MLKLHDFIHLESKKSVDSGTPLGVPALISKANAKGYRTCRGKLFCENGRGFYTKHVKGAYEERHAVGDPDAWVILELKNSRGGYSWKRKKK